MMKESVSANLRYHPGIFLEGLKRIPEDLSHDRRSSEALIQILHCITSYRKTIPDILDNYYILV
jgi:hypothetical protein